ncbi:MAG TPA: NAD(P) transhydrogenase subunit alpha [bacterium]|nr:NAD(P) transhydrogenase subunit alpha [bacterium]
MTGTLLVALYIFVLAIFTGFEVITKVPPLLHTPLMSGANAISGITLVGAVLSTGMDAPVVTTILGTLAVVFATINVIGGFLVTDRMLEMFKKDKE